MAGTDGWDVLSLIVQTAAGLGGVFLGAKITSDSAEELQSKALKRAERDEANARREQLKTRSFTALIRYTDIYSTVATLRLHLRTRAQMAILAGMRMFQGLQPLAPLPADVWATDDDRQAIFEIGGEALLYSLAILPERRNAFIAALGHYNQDRDALQREFPEVVLGGVELLELDLRQAWKLKLRIDDLDRRAVWLVEEIHELHRTTYEALTSLHAAYENRFGEALTARLLHPPETD